MHERLIDAPAARVGELLDSLASSDDRLWPSGRWPAMRFDRPLGTGAIGGHGPIRYTIERYDPGERIVFRFSAPRGFDGRHAFDVAPLGEGRTFLRHILDMRTSGAAILTWPIIFRPLHDALIEDAMDRAEEQVGSASQRTRWSLWVRFLRRALSRSRV